MNSNDNTAATHCHEPIGKQCEDFQHPCKCHQYKTPCQTCRQYDGKPKPETNTPIAVSGEDEEILRIVNGLHKFYSTPVDARYPSDSISPPQAVAAIKAYGIDQKINLLSEQIADWERIEMGELRLGASLIRSNRQLIANLEAQKEGLQQ